MQDAVQRGYWGKILSVGTWLEPNDWAHRNYCGPAATQVALDARLPAAQVPDIETIATEENIDPNEGVWLVDIRNVLNARLGTPWYEVASVTSQSSLAIRLMSDINNDYAMVTGVSTYEMPGWSVTAPHIVAVYGYGIYGSGTAYYVETAGSVAGYFGTYRQSALMPAMYTYVSGNPWHVW